MKKYGFAADEMVKIIDAHFASLVLYARQWSVANAEDLVQEAMMKLLKQSYKKGCPENAVAWLFQVVRNSAVSEFRKNSRRTKHEQNFAQNQIRWTESVQHQNLEASEISDMLDGLALELRELVIMRIWGGLSFDEMATLTGTPRTTLFRKYTEAIEILKKRIEP